MFRTRYFRFLFIAAAAVAVACTDDPVDPADTENTDPAGEAEPASLTLNFSIADLGVDVSTRANAGTLLGDDERFPPLGVDLMDPNTPWPELRKGTDEKPLLPADHEYNYYLNEGSLIDGWKMSCLTVILINYKENKIVGVRRIPDPDCPNHAAVYLTGNQEGEGLKYPPDPNDPDYKTQVADAKKNCILNENGSLADVLRDIDGHPVLDEQHHITGLIGTKACVTFDYEDPKHIVDNDMLNACAKKLYPDDQTAQNNFINENKKYLGQSAEKLVRGEYTLLVVANYDHNVTTSHRDGGSSSEDKFPTLSVDKTLEKIANEFHKPENMANGIPDFRSNYKYLYDIRFLMNRTLEKVETQSGGQTTESYNVIDLPVKDSEGNPLKPYIRPAVHQTLSTAKDIYLEAGNNVIDIELLRIASRTRVEVKNYADTPLKVHSLEFSPNYTQSTCYLFRRNKSDAEHHFRDYSELASTTTGLYNDHDGKGAPMVNYVGIYNYITTDKEGNPGKTYGAIVPFVNDWDFDGNDGVKDGVIVESITTGKNKKCIFDALMYESHLDYKDEETDPDSFYYIIDVSYPDVKAVDADNNGIADTKGYIAEIEKIDTEKDFYFDHYDSSVIKYETLLVNERTDAKDYIKPVPGEDFDVEYVKRQIDNVEDGLNKDAKGNVRDMGESLCFFVQTVSGGKYMYEKADGTLYAEHTGIETTTADIDVDSYLWVIEDLELSADGKECYCRLKNIGSGHYMPTVSEGVKPIEQHCLICTPNAPTQKHKLEITNNNFTFSSNVGGTTYYANLWGDETYFGGWTAANAGSQFRLYPIKRGPLKFYDGTPRMKKKVTLTAFSDATGYVEKVREIRRNDFIRILVEVSYDKQSGDFMFEVNNWDNGGGDVEFH